MAILALQRLKTRLRKTLRKLTKLYTIFTHLEFFLPLFNVFLEIFDLSDLLLQQLGGSQLLQLGRVVVDLAVLLWKRSIRFDAGQIKPEEAIF